MKPHCISTWSDSHNMLKHLHHLLNHLQVPVASSVYNPFAFVQADNVDLLPGSRDAALLDDFLNMVMYLGCTNISCRLYRVHTGLKSTCI